MKVSYGLRAFILYFLILGALIWFTLDNAIERLNDGMRQSAESVLVDSVNILAGFIEDEAQQNNAFSTSQLKRVFNEVQQRRFEAKIYQVLKESVDSHVYVTDDKGIIIYDSSGLDVGKDYSRWRDVKLTLEGSYGARTSFLDDLRRKPDDPKGMIVAAPINLKGETIGVVSLVKPINSLEGHLLTETKQLQRYVFALLAIALLIGYLLSLWFTRSIKRIADYANDMAEGKRVTPPDSKDDRLANLTTSISNLRRQLDGKDYVENYIHGLTHELKTPLTSIRGAVELINDDMPVEDRNRFLENIQRSNQRMSRLVDRMLSLAKLEGAENISTEQFEIMPMLERLIEERHTTINSKSLEVSTNIEDNVHCSGDRVLISQAIANLLDNAIRFCRKQGEVAIDYRLVDGQHTLKVFNQGEAIPDFALDKLFDRFFSLANEDQGESKSTGLGLSFVKQIMHLHKGEVTVQNTANGVVAKLAWPD